MKSTLLLSMLLTSTAIAADIDLKPTPSKKSGGYQTMDMKQFDHLNANPAH